MEFGAITKVENLSSYPPLACAISCVFASVLARLVGKRPVYLISTTIFLISAVWCGLIGKDYNSFFAARFISGLGLGAYEAIVLSSVGDLYFVGRTQSNNMEKSINKANRNRSINVASASLSLI